MRKICSLVFTLTFINLSSCEDVVEVELPTTTPKLVVDGIIRVDFNQEFVPVEIRFSETSNFFENNVPVTLDGSAVIFYGQADPDAPDFIDNLFSSSLAETQTGSGVYVPDPNFSSDQRIRSAAITPDTIFYLVIAHEGQQYTAQTLFSYAVPIDNVAQGERTLFDEDDLEFKITITDTPQVKNYYVFDFGEGDFLPLDDQFIDGQEFEFSYFPDRDFIVGESFEISILGADQQFFNYMNLLIDQTENNGGIFETPAATVRGNVFNVTGLENIFVFDNVAQTDDFALGYFAVTEEYKQSITVIESGE